MSDTVCDRSRPPGRRPAAERQVKVGIADSAVATGPVLLSTSGLGSCVAVALRDPTSAVPVAGLLHAMLPRPPAGDDDAPAAKFVDGGVEELVDALAEAGADPSALTGKLVGGSSMLGFDDDIGSRSTAVAHDTLDAHGIPVVASDVGGDHGRSVRFYVADGRLFVHRATGSKTVL